MITDTMKGGPMRFRVARDTFADAVQWTVRTLPTRPAIPVLAGIKIKVEEGIVQLSSFDYEVSAQCQVEAEVEEPGEILVPGRLLADIAKALPNKDISVTKADNHIRLKCGNADFTLNCMSIDDYPRLPELPPKLGSIDAPAFAEAVSQVVIAASKDEAIPLLSGTKLTIDGSKMTLFATDRYRLALRETEWNPDSPEAKADLLVRSRVLTDVVKSMSGGGAIDIYLTPGETTERSSLIGFSAQGRQTTSVLMDGDYPPVLDLFPADAGLRYTCNRQELLEAARRVSLVAERKTSVRLTFEDGMLGLEAGQDDNAKAHEAVAMYSDSENIQTAFNPQYLIEGLSVCDTEFVRFHFTHPTKAAVMEGCREKDGPSDTSFRYLLMPIRYGA